MADPQHGSWDVFGWVQVIATGIATALGSVMAWWKSTKKTIDQRITRVEKSMEDNLESVNSAMATHQTKIAVLEAQQINTHQQLQAIHEDTREIRDKLGGLSETLMNVLFEVKRRRT